MKSKTAIVRLLLYGVIAFIILTPKALAENATPSIVSVDVPASVQGVEPKATQVNPWQYELYYDDGTPEGAISWSVDTTNHYFAVKFNISNPLSYPIAIDKIRFLAFKYFNGPVKFVVFDSDGTTFLWNSSTLWPRSLPANGEWIEVDCGLVVHRDFYIAVYYTSVEINGWTAVGLDKDSPSGHSYYGPPMAPETEYPGNFMIRATVSQVPIGGRLADDTLYVNFLPTTLLLAPAILLSAYLLLTRRKTRI